MLIEYAQLRTMEKSSVTSLLGEGVPEHPSVHLSINLSIHPSAILVAFRSGPRGVHLI